MSQDEITKDEFDTDLTRLFAEKNEPLSGNEFTWQLLSCLNREYRMRQVRRWCVITFVLVLAALIAPWVVRITTGLFSLASDMGRVPGGDTISMLGMVLVSVVMIYRARRRI